MIGSTRPGFFLSLVTLPLVAGCAGAETPERETGRTPLALEIRLVLTDAAGNEAHEFRAGEPIRLVVTIANHAREERTLTLPSSQTHDCIVSAEESGEVWRWSSGRMFAPMTTELKLAPGAARSYTTTWDQTGPGGTPAPAGVYRAVGLVPAAGMAGTVSAPVTFTIGPSPPS